MATKVKVRTKPINGGMDTVYLDFYPAIKHPDTGKPTRREFLGVICIFDRAARDRPGNERNGKGEDNDGSYIG